jgi:hypothetical protein
MVAALVGVALLGPASAVATPVPAKSAGAFVNSIGVATHTSYSNTVYASRFQELKAKLAELGVHHIREDLMPERPDQYKRLNELAAMGIGSTLIMGKPTNGVSGLNALTSTVKNDLTKVDALEGPNEWYLSGQRNWGAQVAEYQKLLYTAVKSDPALASLPVLGPSTIFWQTGELGDISQWLDYGTIHPYPGGYPAEGYLSRHLEFAKLSSGSKPVVATETGYQTALNSTGTNQPVSEAAKATYMPRIFLEYFRRGVARTFAYQLVDQSSNPNFDEVEAHYGLLRNDLSATPSFDALRNMIDILGEPNTSFSPGTLDYSLGGNQENLHQLLLQKQDGSFCLALWRDTSVWDPVNKVALNPGSSPVTISFQQPIANVQTYAPNSSSTALSSISSPTSPLSLEIGPQVRIVRIATGDPSSPPTGEQPAPEIPTGEPTTEPAPTGEPAPAPESEPTRKGKGGKPKRLMLWAPSGSAQAGHRLVVHGRVIGATPAPATPVAIQRWKDGWHTVEHGHSSRSGFFDQAIRVTGRPHSGVVRIRVVAPAAVPSRPIHVRVTA